MLNILFMGTPDFAKESLEAVYDAGHNILGVVTNPDKPKGRGMKMVASPVKEFAIEKNIPVYQPIKVRNNQEFIDEIADMEGEWGNGLDEPLVAIKDIPLNLTNDNIKGRLNVIWDFYDIKFIKKFASNAWKEEYINKNMMVDVIAKCIIDGYTKKGILEIVDIIPM